jgi:hypothetical protein
MIIVKVFAVEKMYRSTNQSAAKIVSTGLWLYKYYFRNLLKRYISIAMGPLKLSHNKNLWLVGKGIQSPYLWSEKKQTIIN